MGVIRSHRALAGVLAIAVALRAAVAVVHRPALFFSDSWDYLSTAFAGSPVGFSDSRPSGYQLIVRILSEPIGLHPAAITALQHLAGLAGGVILYALLLRLGVRRGWAATAAAVLLFDLYAIALEQHLLTEAFFTLALVGALGLTVIAGGRVWPLAAAGGLLAAAVTMRTVGLFLIPIWLLYLVWTRPPPRAIAVAAAAIALPVLGYLTVHERQAGTFSFVKTSGWFSYGRIGEISHCDGVDVAPEARPLCENRPAGGGVLTYLWNPVSPAWRLFGNGPSGDAEENRILGEFARDVIRARPGRYATLVLADFGRFFVPWEGSRGRSDTAIELPRENSDIVVDESIRDRFLPGYTPRVRAGAGPLADLGSVLHTPRWLMAIFALASIAAVARRSPHHREIVLLTGGALTMLLASAATSEMVVRYMLPTVPLLIAGGALALHDLRPSRA